MCVILPRGKLEIDTMESWKYKNSTGRHIYNHKIRFPFRLLSAEFVKKFDIITYRDTEAERFWESGLGDALCAYVGSKPVHVSRISHGMCIVQLQTGCGSDDRLSAGELSVLAWQIKNAIFAEMVLCQELFPEDILKLKRLNYPVCVCCALEHSITVMEMRKKTDPSVQRLAIIYDLSGKVRVLYAYLADKLSVQASEILDFGWLAVKQSGEGVLGDDFDTKRYLDMMSLLLRWVWPATKEHALRNIEGPWEHI